jgi:hypothetical protein
MRAVSGCNSCFKTGMFALPSLMSHVRSAAFFQLRLRLVQACSPVFKHLLESSTFDEGPEQVFYLIARDPKYLPYFI